MNHSEQPKEPGKWTVESGSDRQGDVRIHLREIGDKTTVIECMTPYESMFGQHLREQMQKLVDQAGLSHICLRVEDHGAWDYVLRARFEACLKKWENKS